MSFVTMYCDVKSGERKLRQDKEKISSSKQKILEGKPENKINLVSSK